MADYDSLEQPLVVGKDWSVDVLVEQAASAVPRFATATGLTLTAYVAQTAAGASAVAATVSELTGSKATYRIAVDGAAITANALGADGAVVYVVLKQGTKLLKVWKVYFYTTDRIS